MICMECRWSIRGLSVQMDSIFLDPFGRTNGATAILGSSRTAITKRFPLERKRLAYLEQNHSTAQHRLQHSIAGHTRVTCPRGSLSAVA